MVLVVDVLRCSFQDARARCQVVVDGSAVKEMRLAAILLLNWCHIWRPLSSLLAARKGNLPTSLLLN